MVPSLRSIFQLLVHDDLRKSLLTAMSQLPEGVVAMSEFDIAKVNGKGSGSYATSKVSILFLNPSSLYVAWSTGSEQAYRIASEGVIATTIDIPLTYRGGPNIDRVLTKYQENEIPRLAKVQWVIDTLVVGKELWTECAIPGQRRLRGGTLVFNIYPQNPCELLDVFANATRSAQADEEDRPWLSYPQ